MTQINPSDRLEVSYVDIVAPENLVPIDMLYMSYFHQDLLLITKTEGVYGVLTIPISNYRFCPPKFYAIPNELQSTDLDVEIHSRYIQRLEEAMNSNDDEKVENAIMMFMLDRSDFRTNIPLLLTTVYQALSNSSVNAVLEARCKSNMVNLDFVMEKISNFAKSKHI